MGILWCNRGEFDKAKKNLLKALAVFNAFKSAYKGHIMDIHDLLDPEQVDMDTAAHEAAALMPSEARQHKEHGLEMLNTHTYYYLAQAYEKTGDRDRASRCCHLTLKKQLEHKEFQPRDWAVNAATLSYYYLTKGSFTVARLLLAAAGTVADRHRRESEDQEYPSEQVRADACSKYRNELGP